MVPSVTSLRPNPFRTSIAANFGKPQRHRQGMLFALLHSQADPSVPTFRYQSALPRLPLPPLRQTLDKYLRSLEPFYLVQQQHPKAEPVAEARAKREAWARSFETGLGNQCQQRLQELVESAPYNWLDDHFWLRKAYLESRSSLLVQSNWWLALQDDTIIPDSIRLSSKPKDFNVWQLRRAAWVIKRMLEFKSRLDVEKIPPDLVRSAPLCMSHYKRMFNMTRIPQTQCDKLHKASPSDPAARQIVVLIKNHMFLVDVYQEGNVFIGLDSMVKRLAACVDNVPTTGPAVSVPILTADDRDTWAKNRNYLSNLSTQNQAALSSIDSSLFCISLDSTTSTLHNSYIPTDSDNLLNPRWDDHLHNTAYGQNGHNRWLDKTVSMSVESNTRLGMMGEHSPCDALIPSILGDYCVEEPMHLEEFEQTAEGLEQETGGWRRIAWTTDSHIQSECRRVSEQARNLTEDSDDSQLWFEDYGVGWMRGIAKTSPDAFIQMALQMAWFKDQGKFTAVYETASTRLFLHGRTEVIRSFSRESLLFVQAMNRSDVKQIDRLRLLQSAIKAHNNYTREASSGQGIDRHLMALRLVMKPGEEAELFNDELFSQCQEWKLSTSGLSSGDRFIGTGFGSPYPDGYGINYLAGADILKFGIESKRSCLTTSTSAFKKALVQSLREIRVMCEEGLYELESSRIGEEQVQARL